MKKLNNIILIVAILFVSIACDDILVEDISDNTIQIVFPREGAIIEGNTVQFLWNNLEGIDNYRIQIIKRGQILEVDSLVTTNPFTYILNSGSFQWRLKGSNFAYETDYTAPVNFSIQTSNDLSNQNIALQTPSDSFYTNDKNIIFTWNEISNAFTYSFILAKKMSGEQTIFQQTEINSNSLTIDVDLIDEDAEYIWKVKGVNTTSETPFSERSIFIDTEVPNQPILSLPANQEIVSFSNVTFNWVNGTDSGNIQSVITNTFEISTDVNFNTIIHSTETTNNSAQYEFDTINKYYWRVKANDVAGNTSEYSVVRSIIVQ